MPRPPRPIPPPSSQLRTQSHVRSPALVVWQVPKSELGALPLVEGLEVVRLMLERAAPVAPTPYNAPLHIDELSLDSTTPPRGSNS